jgi:hypothetical protein
MATFFYPESKFTFGKYKGQLVAEILQNDPEYIQWCVDNIHWFRFKYEPVITEVGLILEKDDVVSDSVFFEQEPSFQDWDEMQDEEDDDYGLGFDYDGHVYEL